jgi:hydrogenase/urease accessory protein HupE
MKFTFWWAVALMFLAGSPAHAHEIGTTRVSVTFTQGASYNVEVVTDAASLVEKLSGQTPPPDANSTVLQNQLCEFDAPFRRRVVLAFDGAAVTPDIDYAVTGIATATSSPIATIHLKGHIPQNARQFAWTYSWTFATYSLTVGDGIHETQVTEWLEGGQTSRPVSLVLPSIPVKRVTIALRYLALGVTHIVPNGFDHMLFVLGIFLLSRRLRQVLAQVSAFTIAHSITLALSIYGIVSVSPKIVEPMIAVSIAYVAIENIFLSDLKPWRVALIFVFGLLHGMGFAGALKELGLPRSEFVTALVTFNVGVEAGQLAVIGTAFLLVGWYCGRRNWYRKAVVMPASALIACTAIYWTVQRVLL